MTFEIIFFLAVMGCGWILYKLGQRFPNFDKWYDKTIGVLVVVVILCWLWDKLAK